MGPLFSLVKYAAAAYLIWRGYCLFMERTAPAEGARSNVAGWRDIGFGALITLANPKAILFYGAIMPTFFDMTSVSAGDFLLLIAIVGATSFLVYGSYIALTHHARRFLTSTRAARRVRQAAGSMLVVSGIVVATR